MQAEEILAGFDPENLDEWQLAVWGITRVSILFWSGDVGRANEVLALLRERVQHPSLKLVVDATASLMAVHENRIAEGIAAAEHVLADPHAPKQAIDFAAFGAGLAMPVAGRGGDFEPIAARCRAEQKATDGMIRVMVRYCDVLALTSIGELDLADRRAAEYAEFSSAGQRLGWAIAKIAAGLVAAYRGKFPDVISSIEQALAAQAAEAPLPWQLPARVVLVKAYAALGRTEEADRVLADAEEHTGQFMALHDPQLMIAKSWLAAAKGLRAPRARIGPRRRRCRTPVRSVRRGSRGAAPCGTVWRPHRRGATGGTRRTRRRTRGHPASPPRCSRRRRRR